jgi:hypothetical protein
VTRAEEYRRAAARLGDAVHRANLARAQLVKTPDVGAVTFYLDAVAAERETLTQAQIARGNAEQELREREAS